MNPFITVGIARIRISVSHISTYRAIYDDEENPIGTEILIDSGGMYFVKAAEPPEEIDALIEGAR